MRKKVNGGSQPLGTTAPPNSEHHSIGSADCLKPSFSGESCQAARWNGSLTKLMGTSPQIQKVIEEVERVAPSPFAVLIEGETGTGKELIARAIHRMSGRREREFVTVDCGALPETRIESELFGHEKGAFAVAHQRKEGSLQLAHGGSLFLDEIVSLPLATQPKLHRALQERQVRPLGAQYAIEVHVRIIAASNVSLEGEVRAGRFRNDLYYRLREFIITLPPLRDRVEDILYLATGFLAEASLELRRPVPSLSDEAAQLLLRYSWPGNVRELRNVMRRAALLCGDVIGPEHLLPFPMNPSSAPLGDDPSPAPAGRSLKEVAATAAGEAEQQAIRQALQATQGNKSEVARRLRVDYKTLHLKMKRYRIRASEFRAS